MINKKELTLIILVDAGKSEYFEHLPFIKEMKKRGVLAEKLYNPGGYCERSCFMTGALPEVTGNLFAMSLMPIGYKRADYEPRFNIPLIIRNRLCMTEDVTPDTDEGAFVNPDTGEVIESIWDVMRKHNKTWVFEACLSLGIRQHNGRTTHGSRAIQLLEKIKNENPDVAYMQISETDQYAHIKGNKPENIKNILNLANGDIEYLYTETSKLYNKVNLLVFGDHGQTTVTEHLDLAFEYPGFVEGWDYMYLKSSAAVQIWIFNERVRKYILNDPKLNSKGKFIKSPSKRQGDIIWACNEGILITPCHFHPRGDEPVSMHGYQLNNPALDSEKGFAFLLDGKNKGTIKQIWLNDLASTITELIGIPAPKFDTGISIQRRIKNVYTTK